MFLEQRLANPKQAHSCTALFWIANVRYGGSPPSPPPPPPPPDYAAANRAGVLADVQTLGAKREIENAAKLGGTALGFGVETRTRNVLNSGYEQQGNRYFTGTGRNRREVSASEATTPRQYYVQIFDEDGKRYSTPKEITSQEAILDFRGKSDLDAAKAVSDFQRQEQKANAQQALDLQRQYGTQFASEARNQLQAIDPTGYANRELLGSRVANTNFEGIGNGPTFTQSGYGPQYEMSSNSPSMSRLGGGPSLARLDSGSALERADGGPSLSRQGYGPQFQAGDENAGGGNAARGRAEIERQLGENLFNNGKLTEEQSRRLNNAVRGAQTARGNIYGNAPTAQEILTRSGAEQDMARQARADVVGYLQSGQSSYDVANAIRQEANQLAQQGYINYSTANTVNNNLAQQEYQNRLGALGQRNQASQTELSNRAQSAAFNNQSAQSEYQNYVNQVGANNAVSQQEFQNQQTALGQRNQAQQSMYQNQLGAIASNNQLAQQAYGNQLAAIQQRNAATQQGIANLQSYAGLQPIVTQGGQLGALGQGAAPTIQTPIPQGANINPNAGRVGTDFALGVYGNQTSQYNAQLNYLSSTYATAQKNSPLSWITGIGGVLF